MLCEYDVIILVQNNRTRESSVAIDPSWQMLEEIEFHRLAKLRLDVDEPEELYPPFSSWSMNRTDCHQRIVRPPLWL
jgi:Eukaryotic translation initiation factor 3 subunit 7 (eIF-3)